jgi:hypothetical protein
MQTGTKISAIGHGAVILLAVFGLPWFGPRERTEVRVTEVSFVTEAEFEAAQTVAAPEAPREETAPPAPPRARPQAAPAPEPVVEAAPEPPQQTVAAPEPPAAAEAPEPARITPRVITLDPPTAAAPPSRPAPRVEPNPTPPPPETARPAETPEPVTAPEPEAVARLETPPAAPPEAAPDAAAEAAPEAPLALETSGRPRARPVRQARRAPEPERVQTADAVMAAVRQEASRRAATPPTEPTPATAPTVTEPTAAAATSLPVGPPLSSSEKDGLRLAVQRCWNVPAGLRDAQELKVTLAAELGANGEVINASIRLIEPSPAPDARFQQAYEAGRRALIRCSPYDDLPRDKYAQWRQIEVVFNPEGMVSW